MMSNNSSEDLDFQPYIDSVKHKKTPWNIFEKLMKDLTRNLDCEGLKKLNAILLLELMNTSDQARLKYLNIILVTELKNFIHHLENTERKNEENEVQIMDAKIEDEEENQQYNPCDELNTQDSTWDSELNEEMIKENESENQIMDTKNQEFIPQYGSDENETT